MSYAKPTADEVGRALANLGTYRVIFTQQAAGEGPPDGIGGHHLLVLGLRETWLRNVNSEAQTDRGWCQLSMAYHEDWLASQPGCPEGTWKAVDGHVAAEPGFCARFTPSCVYALDILKGNKRYAERKGVPSRGQVSLRVAFNGFNRGIDGAIQQYHQASAVGDNIDVGTTGNDYGIWCVVNAQLVKTWLSDHANWRPK